MLLVLIQIVYMMKLAERLRERNVESDEKIREMQENWNKLETVINNLAREINQARMRTQEVAMVPQLVQRVQTDEPIGNRATSRRIIPARSTDMYTLTLEP